MFGSADDDPKVELLGNDEVVVGNNGALSERRRSWWPLWVAAALLGAVGLGAAFQSNGASGNSEAAGVDETAVPPSTTRPSGDSTTVPTTGPFDDRDVEAIEEADEANQSMTTWQSTDATSSGDGSENVVLVGNVEALGLDGYLYAWRAATLHRLDLSTGEWHSSKDQVGYRETWGPPMVASGTGVVTTSSNGEVRSLDADGRTLDELQVGFSPQGVAVSDGEVAILDYALGSDDELRVHVVDEQGKFVEIQGLPEVSGLTFATVIVGVDGRFFVSVISGGIFEVSAPGAPRVADGYAIGGGDGVGLLRIHCDESLGSCDLELLEADDLSSVIAIDTGIEDLPNILWEPGAWSPDLQFLLHPWNGTVTSLDGTSTRYIEELESVDGPPSSSAWSPDSRWLAVQHDGHIVFYDPRSDERVMVAAPWSQDGRGRVQSGLAFSPLAN